MPPTKLTPLTDPGNLELRIVEDGDVGLSEAEARLFLVGYPPGVAPPVPPLPDEGYSLGDAKTTLSGVAPLIADGFDPHQPRDPNTGEWIEVPGLGRIKRGNVFFFNPDGSLNHEAVAKKIAESARRGDRQRDADRQPDVPRPVQGTRPTAAEVERFDIAVMSARSSVRATLRTVRDTNELTKRNTPEREAVDFYTSGGSILVNAWLRGTGHGRYDRQTVERALGGRGSVVVGVLDELMRRSQTSSDVVVWRGVSEPRRIFGDAWCDTCDNAGLTWHDRAPVSTSADADFMATALRDLAVGSGKMIMRILVPRGTAALHAQNNTGKQDQSELLLDRNYGYQLIRDHGVGRDGVRRVDVEVISRGAEHPR